jgi:hypothetical protein
MHVNNTIDSVTILESSLDINSALKFAQHIINSVTVFELMCINMALHRAKDVIKFDNFIRTLAYFEKLVKYGIPS